MTTKHNSSSGGSITVQPPATAGNYTLTLPAATDTLVGKATTDTLTNKTLTTPVINGFTGDTSAITIGSDQIVKATDGKVGIGVIPSVKLNVYSVGAVGSWIAAQNSTTGASATQGTQMGVDGSGNGFLWNYEATSLTLGTNNLARLTINSVGEVGIGTGPSAGYRLAIKGVGTTSGTNSFYAGNSGSLSNITCRDDGYTSFPSTYANTTASAANIFMDASGYIYRSTSSLKYKDDVQDATHGLIDLLKLRSVTYKGKSDGDTIFGGLIAEEVHAAGLSEFVQYAEDGSPDALAYGPMVSLCIKAIQELTARVIELENAA